MFWRGAPQRIATVPGWPEPVHVAGAPNDDLVVWSAYADGLLVTHDAGETLLSTDGASIHHVALHPAWPNPRRVLAAVASGEVFDLDVAGPR